MDRRGFLRLLGLAVAGALAKVTGAKAEAESIPGEALTYENIRQMMERDGVPIIESPPGTLFGRPVFITDEITADSVIALDEDAYINSPLGMQSLDEFREAVVRAQAELEEQTALSIQAAYLDHINCRCV